MTTETSNPYEGPIEPPLPETRYRRSALSIAAAVVHTAGYLILVMSAASLLLITLLLTGLEGVRIDELALAMLVIAAGAIAVWLLLNEVHCFRVLTIRRERLLSRLAMVATFIPLMMSLLWLSEYLAYGFYDVNAVPAMWMAVLALVWLLLAFVRFGRTRRNDQDSRA